MIRKKQILAAALSATMLFGAVAVFADDDDTMTSYLTGEPVSEEQGLRRPIAFTIDNVTAAIPQSGISEADMYYECEVETDLSRITAVFEQYDGIEKIGPLRSCRDYFISLVSGLDPIYQHYGQAAYALPYLESDDVDNISGLLDYGVEGFKMDPARTIDEHPDAAYFNGRTDKEMHNLNQVLLQKQMNQMSRKHVGKRIWYHYTAGWAGTQHWGASTSGDNGGGKTALFDQLNLGNSAYMNLSCDVMSVPKELEMHGLHFGLFLPWVQINSWFSMMQPFYYGEPEQSIYRDYVQLRYSLMPYIYSAALEGGLTGMPIVRSMPLMFPEDRSCDDMCYQYMFGDSFCVGIFSNEIYLPAGVWVDAWTGERVESRGETFTRGYPENRAGLLFIRDGAIIPTQKPVQCLGTKPFYVLYEDDGDSYGYETGAVASTLFQSREGDGSVNLVVNPVQGSYAGMPATRDFQFQVALRYVPSKVLVNGREVSGWTFGDDAKLQLTVLDAPVNEALKISVVLSGEEAAFKPVVARSAAYSADIKTAESVIF